MWYFIFVMVMVATKIVCGSPFPSAHICQSVYNCKCWIENDLMHMDCSRKELWTIPRFPSKVNILDLQHNELTAVESEQFINLENLTELDLCFNRIQYLYKNAFDNLYKLEKLNLSKNYLRDSNSYAEGIFKPLKSLNCLNIQFNFNYQIPDNAIADLSMLEKIAMDFYDNETGTPFGEEFTALKMLKELKVGYCESENLRQLTFTYLKHLEHIDLSFCRIRFYEKGSLNMTHLKYLDISNSYFYIENIDDLFSDLRFTAIRTLIASHAVNSKSGFLLEKNFFNNFYVTNIKELQLQKNGLKCKDIFFVIPSTLLYLDLSYNQISSCKFYLSNLVHLKLQYNNYGPFLRNQSFTFAENTKLQEFDLASNGIQELIYSLFHYHPSLSTINLSHNKIQELTFDLSQTKELKLLNLSSNFITTFDQKFMDDISAIIKTSCLKIDLSKNLLQCSCQNVEFLQWMMVNKQHFHGYQSYTCKFQNGSIILLQEIKNIVSRMEEECRSYTGLIIVVSLGIITACMTVSAGLLYRYRWKLRYMFYMTKRRLRRHQTMPDDGEYNYSAFISYSEKELDFILNGFIKNLEQSGNRKLCVNERDFLPGVDKTDNITNAIHTSRKTICVITRSYLDSYYCIFEFNMARMESIYSRNGQNVLFLVFYEQIQTRDLPLVMLELVQQQQYIEYPNDEQGNVVFWQKIRETIG